MSTDIETPVDKIEQPTPADVPADVPTDDPTDAPTNGNHETDSTTATTVESTIEYDPKRLYIGNLPFKSTHKELRDLFESYNIVSLNIPKSKVALKSGRMFFKKLGYAFAEFPTEEDAKLAVENVNETVLNDRQLNVRFARVVDRKTKKEKTTTANGTSSTTITEEYEKVDGANETSTTATTSVTTTTPRPAAKKRVPRKKRPTGPDSTDTVFVANLPPSTTSEELGELFKSFSPSEIKLVVKKPKKVKKKTEVVTLPGRTLAFIKLADEASQKKAIEEFNGKSFKEVELQVKVATELVNDEDEEGSAGADAVVGEESTATSPATPEATTDDN